MKELEYNGKVYKLGQKVRINSGSNTPENNGKIGTIKSFSFDGKETVLKGFMEISLEDGNEAHVYDEWYGKHDVDILEESYKVEEKLPHTTVDNAVIIQEEPKMREFDTGATRNTDDNKLDFEGFISPLALEEFAKYMHEHRMQADGKLRDSDNWQKGIPQDQYMKSMWRHFFDTWKNHRGHETPEDQIKNLCGLMFNVQGYLHELLKQK